MLFDYFLDLWTSLEILLDFFRISSDRRDVSLENHENARWLLGKSGPACRRDARKHKVICSRWRSKRAPQGNPKSTKILDFRQNWCGVRLASSWLHFGSVLASAWLENHQTLYVLTTFRLFEFVAFTNTLYFTSFLTTFGLLQSSSSLRFSRTLMTRPSRKHSNLFAFWLLSGPANSSRNSSDKPFPYQENHENNIFVIVFDSFRAPGLV